MFRFTIRDVLWLMVVFGLAICLYRDRTAVRELKAELGRAQDALRKLDLTNGRLIELMAKRDIAAKRQNDSPQY